MLCSMNKTNWEIFLYLGRRIIALSGTHAAAGTVRISLENRNLNRAGASGIRSAGHCPRALLARGQLSAEGGSGCPPSPPVRGRVRPLRGPQGVWRASGSLCSGPGLCSPEAPTEPPGPSHAAGPWSVVTSPPLKAGPEAQRQARRSRTCRPGAGATARVRAHPATLPPAPDGAPLLLCTWPPPRPTPQAPSHPAPTGHCRSR